MSEWISVKTRLPEEDGSYLVYFQCHDGDGITIMYFRVENKFLHLPVTHWMPLPNPPETEGQK